MGGLSDSAAREADRAGARELRGARWPSPLAPQRGVRLQVCALMRALTRTARTRTVRTRRSRAADVALHHGVHQLGAVRHEVEEDNVERQLAATSARTPLGHPALVQLAVAAHRVGPKLQTKGGPESMSTVLYRVGGPVWSRGRDRCGGNNTLVLVTTAQGPPHCNAQLRGQSPGQAQRDPPSPVKGTLP